MLGFLRSRRAVEAEAVPAHSAEAVRSGTPDGMQDAAQTMRSELARHLPLLEVLKAQVQGTATQIEEAVVAVCSTFQQIAEQARAGVTRASDFLSGREHRSDNAASVEDLIGQARNTFESLLGTLGESAEVSRQAVERMREIDRQAEKIRAALKLLEGIGEGNRILALNARIEAAHAGAYGKGFEVVATEVIAQTDRSQAVIGEVTQTIRSLRADASSALADLTRMSEQSLASAEAERRRVERALAGFNNLDHEMRSLLQSASEDSIRLSNEIGQAVRGMQFQDRVNQRLGHVVEALDDSHQRLTGSCDQLPQPDASLVEELMMRYTMHEERSAAHRHESEAGAGDVELF